MIYITDGQDGNILDVIPDKYIEEDWHERSLSSLEETYELTTWADMPFSEHLQDRNRLLIPDEDGTYREFIITIPRKYRDGQRLVLEVTALASYLEDLVKAKVIEPHKTESITNVEHVKNTLEGTIWQPGNIKYEGIRTLTIDKNTNPFAFLKRLANEFKLEINFRIEIEYNRVVGRYVDMVERIGEWRGRTIEYGKDLLGIERTEDTSNVVTSLIGYGPERDDGTRLKVVVEDKEALERWGMRDPKTGALKHLVAEYEPRSNDQDMTLDRLRTLVENELEKRIKALVSYKVNFADVEHVPGLENEKVRFGDTLRIKDTQFNPPLYLEARIRKLSRSTVDKTKKQTELGDFTEYTEEEVNAIWQSLQNEIRNRLSKLLVTTIVSSAGTTFKNGVGSTELSATVFLTGNETDKDGTLYDYKWAKRDKDGNLTSFEANGKTITVNAEDIDQKATYIVDVMQDGHTLSLGVITISNVFDGTQGIPGKPGEDGRTSYFHTAYANSADGNLDFSLTNFDGKLYIGTYTDFEPNDSTDPSDYKWARFKGEQGPRGLQGLQGPEGDQGIKGDPGEDGKSSYTHIAYADDKQGGGFSQDPTGKEYMGVYVDHQPQDSDNPNDYKWSLIKGQDGEDGIPGKPGEDGRTPYLHIAYADDAQGGGFSQSPDGKEYIGTYTDFTQADSDNPNDYTWQRTKGDKGDRGPQGVPGPKGKDGQTLYTWVKYADTPTSGMSDNPTGKEYIGLAYNKTSPNESSDYNDYQWTKAKGDQGAPGPKGDDGQTTYTWVKYADDKDGNGMSDDSEGKRYLGLAYNKTSPNESTNPSDYNWSPLYDNVQPGVRNLALRSRLDYLPSGGVLGDVVVHEIVDDSEHGSVLHVQSQYYVGFIHVVKNFNVGDKVTMTMFMRAKEPNTLRVKLNNPYGDEEYLEVGTEWEEHSVTTSVKGFDNEDVVLNFYPSNTEYWVKWIKIEKGNIATDWTPAPEDERAYAEYIAKLEAEAERIKAEAYADEKVTEEEQARIDDVQRRLEQAKQHANDVSNEAENNAKQHADSVAQAKAELAETRAKAHADGIVTAEEEARIRDAEEKLRQAKQHADDVAKAEAKLAETEAKAYADGQVTAEEQARIDQARQNLEEAKNHANTKSEEAKEGAKTDVETGKVGLPGDAVTGSISGEHLNIDLAVFGATPQFLSGALWNEGVWTIMNTNQSLDPTRMQTFNYFLFRPTKKYITVKGALIVTPLLEDGLGYAFVNVSMDAGDTSIASVKQSMSYPNNQTKTLELTGEITGHDHIYLRFNCETTSGRELISGMRVTSIYMHD